MFSEETRFCLALNEIKDLGPVLVKRLLIKFNSAKKIFSSSIEELAEVEGIGIERAKRIKEFNNWNEIDRIMKLCEKREIKVYSFNDAQYPGLLKEIYDPPVVLFCKGEIKPEDQTGLAIVGSRKLSEYGRRVTEQLSSEAALYGITIVSGLARGIDSVAHKSALSQGGRTIAVLGSGVLYIYPPENRTLAEKIMQNGAILSEFYPEEGPKKENFPKRNRIISGISIGTVVTEATINSGALITASFALEQGREVFAVPGNITSKNSEGTNYLIQKGAKLVTKIEDILEEIMQFIPSLKKQNKTETVELDNEERAIFDILDEPLTADEIVLRTGINVSKVLEILLKFEINGLINKTEGKYIRRI
ncbi:DNA-processing protein DprA [Thermodesulfovibrio sp. 3907-1M]|uniref:DNA-processing protein DprA n=1 Tax=Thermodesulfovibrio autotrophicus TaxID=3118333 RepID=A0AAU8GXM0_9BACT